MKERSPAESQRSGHETPTDGSRLELGEQPPLASIRRPLDYIFDPQKRSGLAQALRALRTVRQHHLSDWLKSWTGQRNPFREAMPWLSWPCIDYLESIIHPGMKVFEYGGGGSTLFFLARGCDVTTVEGNPDWGGAIQHRVAEMNGAGHFELRLVDITGGGSAAAEAYAEQVNSGFPWDLVLIDGACRLRCLSAAKDRLSSAGVIVFDNTDLPDYSAAHALVPEFERLIFQGLGYGRRAPTTTEVFRQSGRR